MKKATLVKAYQHATMLTKVQKMRQLHCWRVEVTVARVMFWSWSTNIRVWL